MASFFNNYFFIILAIVAGMAMPTQAAINNKLALSVNSPILAAFISFAVGTVAPFYLYSGDGNSARKSLGRKKCFGNRLDGRNPGRVFRRFDRHARPAHRSCAHVFADYRRTNAGHARH